MALIECSECKKQISDSAVFCPGCGNPYNPKKNMEMVDKGKINVVVNDVIMGFSSMVVFMVKWVLASIPAFIILFIIFLVFSTIFSLFVLDLLR